MPRCPMKAIKTIRSTSYSEKINKTDVDLTVKNEQ